MVDASEVTEFDGRALCHHLIKFNYEINDDNNPHLKRTFTILLHFDRNQKQISMFG